MSLSEKNLKIEEEDKTKLATFKTIQKESMDSNEIASLYKIDEFRKRKAYQWNKKKPFTYSNKV